MRPFLERLWFGFVLALFFFFRSQSEYTAYPRYFRRFILFVSFMFPVFLITAALFYFAAPGKYRPALLFAFSCLFCSWLGLRSLFFVFALSVFTFFAARLIEKNRLCAHPLRSRIWSVFSIAFCLLLMAGYKYIPYPPSKKLLLDTGFLMHCMKYFFRIVYFVQVTLNKSL